MEKKSSDKFNPDVGGEIPRVGAEINDEEAPLITSGLSHIGRTQLGNHAAYDRGFASQFIYPFLLNRPMTKA